MKKSKITSLMVISFFMFGLSATCFPNPLLNQVFKRGARSAGKQALKSGSSQIAKLAMKYGDDSIKLIRKGGPSLQKTLNRASVTEGKSILSFYSKTGQSGLRLLDDPKIYNLVAKHGDVVGQVVAKHSRTATKLVTKHGDSAIKPLGKLSRAQGQRLYIASKRGKLDNLAQLSSTEQSKFWKIFSERHQSVLTWIEKNPKSALTAATLTAFILQPNKFLEGAGTLASKLGNGILLPLFSAALPYLTLLAFLYGLSKILFNRPQTAS